MFSLDSQAAVATLQQRADVKKSAHDSFELDRIERALDELVRNSDKAGAPSRLVRSARANALKVVKARREHDAFSLDQEDLHARKRDRVEKALAVDVFAEVEMMEWLDHTPCVTEEQRWLLKALAADFDAEFLALAMNLPIKRVRERISRARRAARTGYRAEVMSA